MQQIIQQQTHIDCMLPSIYLLMLPSVWVKGKNNMILFRQYLGKITMKMENAILSGSQHAARNGMEWRTRCEIAYHITSVHLKKILPYWISFNWCSQCGRARVCALLECKLQIRILSMRKVFQWSVQRHTQIMICMKYKPWASISNGVWFYLIVNETSKRVTNNRPDGNSTVKSWIIISIIPFFSVDRHSYYIPEELAQNTFNRLILKWRDFSS